jgi:hypothetical protein
VPRRILLSLLLVAAAALVSAPAAQATVYTVTRTDDLPGTCTPTPSDCSLRQAVTGTNEVSDRDEIHVPAGTFALEPSLGPLTISGGGLVTIYGAGAGATIVSGSGGTRVFDITGSGLATIADLTVTGGSAVPQGGGIGTAGQLALVGVVVSGNRARTDGAADGAAGGGIVNAGRLTIETSTIASNTADGGTATGAAGGGIYHGGSGLEITNSTIAGNLAGAGGSGGSGGGIYSSGDSVTLQRATVASNTALGGSGGNLFWAAGIAIYSNTIVSGGAAASGVNCAGVPATVTTGQNLESADTCGFGLSALRNVNPLLGPLAANGGPTPTMALAPGSRAIDAAPGCPPPDTDQRGVARPQGRACDIGAFEAPPQPAALVHDTSAPTVRSLRMSPTRLRPLGGHGSSIARKRRHRRGATVRYRLSEAATVTFTLERAVRGVRVGRGCLRVARADVAASSRRRCRTYRRLRGSFKHAGLAGRNKFKFTGRLRGKRLKSGRYRLVARPRDAAGNKGKAKKKRFRVVRR